jgi:hypothetical protein
MAELRRILHEGEEEELGLDDFREGDAEQFVRSFVQKGGE